MLYRLVQAVHDVVHTRDCCRKFAVVGHQRGSRKMPPRSLRATLDPQCRRLVLCLVSGDGADIR
jgi:hypothetical protein